MTELALKIGSIVTTLLVMVGGYGYASTHLKNPNAPLQPAVEKSVAEKSAVATPARDRVGEQGVPDLRSGKRVDGEPVAVLEHHHSPAGDLTRPARAPERP